MWTQPFHGSDPVTLVSCSPTRRYLFTDKRLILRSQPGIRSSKKPRSPRLGHCGGLGNKNGPHVKFRSGSPWVQQQTNQETSPDKQTNSFPWREEGLESRHRWRHFVLPCLLPLLVLLRRSVFLKALHLCDGGHLGRSAGAPWCPLLPLQLPVRPLPRGRGSANIGGGHR